MTETAPYRKKLIEVGLPLEAINAACKREKSIRHGHPSTLHLWWARRPLAACRAVLFSSLVNDPSDDPVHGLDQEKADTERVELFDLIEELVLWENSNNPNIINRARLEIARSIAANKVADGELQDDAPLVAGAPELPEEQARYLPDPPPEYMPKDIRYKMPGLKPEQVNHFLAHYAPPVLDPFAGGGSIPLEAQRLGLRAYGSDLNPAAVLINKALIEIPTKFGNQPPLNPEEHEADLGTQTWKSAQGLAQDVRYYGQWMRNEAEKRIGHLYPKIKVTQEIIDDGRSDLEPYVGQSLNVIAWLWARTVQSPDPSLNGAHTPLIATWQISKKAGNEAWVEASVNRAKCEYQLVVHSGKPPKERRDSVSSGTKISRGKFGCLLSGQPIAPEFIKSEANAGRLGARLVGIVLEGKKKRIYVSPCRYEHVEVPQSDFLNEVECPEISGYFNPPIYGFKTVGSMFTDRQRVSIETFSNLVEEAASKAEADCGDTEYARSIAAYLALAVGRLTNRHTSFNIWNTGGQKIEQVFSEQGVGMAWDYAEANPFSNSSGNWSGSLEWIPKCIENSVTGPATIYQADAAKTARPTTPVVISTDPPYYSSITYADFADFFYGTFRHALRNRFSDLFSTIATPKEDEAVAAWHRFGGDRDKAGLFFTHKLGECFSNISRIAEMEIPVTIFYAFKQKELETDNGLVTAWESILRVILENGLAICNTWPMRTERTTGRKAKKNVLASSIVIVCRPQGEHILTVTRRDFINQLIPALNEAVNTLIQCNLAPIDLQQSSIGPGMSVFSKFHKVLENDGSEMSVRTALEIIDQTLAELLTEQEGEYDPDTRFAVIWFSQFGFTKNDYGEAEVLATSKSISVKGVVRAGILESTGSKVRLLKPEELDEDWKPEDDDRLTVWEVTHYLCRALETGGIDGAADLVRRVGGLADSARDLAYRLFSICDKKKLAADAQRYNALVESWPDIQNAAAQQPVANTSGEESDLFT